MPPNVTIAALIAFRAVSGCPIALPNMASIAQHIVTAADRTAATNVTAMAPSDRWTMPCKIPFELNGRGRLNPDTT
jgi:hypothetical protein